MRRADDRRINRLLAAALVLGCASPAAVLAQHEHHAPRTADHAAAHYDPAPYVGAPVLENLSTTSGIVEVDLTALPARLELLPGVRTNVFAYNGRIPGPLLQVSEGDSVVVRFRNELPVETTVHWHGLHLPFVADGSPFHPVAPGEEFVYAFRLLPGSAGTYWYHPHPHHHTAHQVSKGLYGGIIVRDPADPLPAITEHMLILSDNRFREDGALDFPEPGTPAFRTDEFNGRVGDVLFVNDRILPTLDIRSGEVQRWRVVNASGARVYRLALEGHTLLHVGSDGGLFEHPVEVDEIILSNGERVELLVRAVAEPGARAMLQALPYDRYMGMHRPQDWDRTLDLLVLQYSDAAPVAPIAIPERLRPVPRLDPAEATVTRTIRLSQGKINSRVMQMDRVDLTAELGATEIWQVNNLVGMDHNFHLHGFQFQVLDRNGVPEPQPRWEDTINIPRFESARLIVRFDNYPGMWMFHCHILTHEDQGMMGVLEVRGPARGEDARP